MKLIKNTTFREERRGKDRQKIRFFLIISIISIVSVSFIKGIMRDWHLSLSPLGIFLQGTLPNFFAATAFCSLFFAYFKIYLNLNLKIIVCFACTVSFWGLVLWEILQFLFWNYPIDIYDILMSLAGCCLITILILLLYKTESFGKKQGKRIK